MRDPQPPFVRQALLQGDPFEKLHQDVGSTLRCHAGIENFDDVGMTDGAGRSRFVEETLDQLRVLGKRRVKNLHGRAAFEQRVFGKVDLPKAAFAQ